VLSLIERNGGQQSLPADIVGDIIRGALTLVLKTQHSPDLRGLSDSRKHGANPRPNQARTKIHYGIRTTVRNKDTTEWQHSRTGEGSSQRR
jgi:hypothetical protein